MVAGGSLRFPSNLTGEVRFLGRGGGGGVDRPSKALEKVSEGNLEIDIPLKLLLNWSKHHMIYGSANETCHSIYD